MIRWATYGYVKKGFTYRGPPVQTRSSNLSICSLFNASLGSPLPIAGRIRERCRKRWILSAPFPIWMRILALRPNPPVR